MEGFTCHSGLSCLFQDFKLKGRSNEDASRKKNSEGGGVGDEGEVPSSLPLFFLLFLCSLISRRTPQTERLEQAMV